MELTKQSISLFLDPRKLSLELQSKLHLIFLDQNQKLKQAKSAGSIVVSTEPEIISFNSDTNIFLV